MNTKRILCIDIGGTRIKWAVLAHGARLGELQRLTALAMSSIGWKNTSLPNLVNSGHWAGIFRTNHSVPEFDAVSCAICTELNDKSEVVGHLAKRGVPRDLSSRFERLVNRPVTLQNDSTAWLQGALRYSELTEARVEFPCLALIFGTGVALGYADNAGSIQALEFDQRFRGEALARFIGEVGLRNPSDVHRVLGKEFFDWADRDCGAWDYQRVRQEFTERVVAMVKDIRISYGPARTVFIGGGHAEYASARELAKQLGLAVVPLRNSECKIAPDLISLLGCAVSAQSKDR